MDFTHRIRISLAAAIALCGAGSIFLASNVTAGDPAEELMPDLKTLEPIWEPSLVFEEKRSGESFVRVSNRVVNAGKGPLELMAGGESAPCQADGQYPGGLDLQALQNIYEDTNESAAYDGPDSTQPDAIGETVPVGCFEFHPKHNHWHFQDFSQYKLEDVKTQKLLAGPSRKIGFCILDTDREYADENAPMPGAPESRVYPQAGTRGCGSGTPNAPPESMGLSVGWADTYTYNLPGQRLNVTGIKKGIYCLVSTANPDHVTGDSGDLNQLEESDQTNNARRQRVKINPKEQSVRWLDRNCT